MNWQNALKYTALGLGGFVLVFLVLAIVLSVLGGVLGLSLAVFGLAWGVIGLLWALLVPALSLAALGALVYGAYRLLSESEDDQRTGRPRTERSGGSRVERIKDRYARGEISEQELERRLELELDGPEPLERDLRRERE